MQAQVHAATVLPTRRQKLARFLVRLLGPDSEGGLPTDADEDTQVKVAMEIAKEEGLQVMEQRILLPRLRA